MNSKEYYREYRAKNRLKIREKQRSWYLENREAAKAAWKRYSESGKAELTRKMRETSNKEEYRKKALARAAKCKFSDIERYRLNQRSYQSKRRSLGGSIYTRKGVLAVYRNCPKDLEVDHIIPIKHEQVCGLHVEWNFQYLTRSENARKSNSFDGTYENEGWKHAS